MIPDKKLFFDERRLWGNTKFWGGLLFLLSFGFSYLIIMHLAEGGDVTWFSMFFLYLFAYFYGGVQGLIFATLFGIVKMFGDMYFGLFDADHKLAEIVDYLVSYGVVGLGGFFSQVPKKRADKKKEKIRGVYKQSIVTSDDYNVGSNNEKYLLRIGFVMAMLFRYFSSVINFVVFYYRPEKSLLGNISESLVYCMAYVGVETFLSLLLLLLPWITDAAGYCKYVATHHYEADLHTY